MPVSFQALQMATPSERFRPASASTDSPVAFDDAHPTDELEPDDPLTDDFAVIGTAPLPTALPRRGGVRDRRATQRRHHHRLHRPERVDRTGLGGPDLRLSRVGGPFQQVRGR
ncbi:hypothetical protein AB0L53_50340 [Nonomuraea sp. NPDC052129]|uniref:hypothetical protein n=1 Tax=Nonomuraea sp. NPDC052129 TaxID=3154651 RepID=UPI00343416DB